MKDIAQSILLMFQAGILTQQEAYEMYNKAFNVWLYDHTQHVVEEDGESDEETN